MLDFIFKNLQKINTTINYFLGTMAPSPLIKMSLYLTGKNITFIPNQHELVETFKIIIEEITHLISTIPRLYEKFGLPAGGLKKFTEVIKTDVDSNKLQTLINAGTY